MKTLFLLLSFIVIRVSAQDKNNLNYKISPSLIAVKEKLNTDTHQPFFVVTRDFKALKQYLVEKNLQHTIISEYEASGLLVVRLNWKLIDSVFLRSSLVNFIDVVRTPKEENAIEGFDLSTNKVNLVHNEFRSINGTGTVVSIKENSPDSNDIDLKGRLISTASASPQITHHATTMSTIIAGGGNSYHTGKGVAWGADITSSNFASLIPDADAEYKRHHISVQNHSYGTGIENYYGADAAAYDASTISNPGLLHVFSSGNSGDKSSAVGRYAGIGGYANLTGSFKMAKNIITVGVIDSFSNVEILSSRGPAYDGRIRPELVAFGVDGTSGAAAIVSGTALLLQQAYKERNGGQSAPAPLIKAILLNSADDVGPTGIDFLSGYGSVNAYNALQGIMNRRYLTNNVSQGEVQSFSLNVPANLNQLKITISWNDVPAGANEAKSLINDLDLRLVHNASGNMWHPWVLNSFPHPDSLKQLPVRARDSLNNTEQITIPYPSAGQYTIEVKGYNISQGTQPYYISYQWDSINQFKWHYPAGSDHIVGNQLNTLRWGSTFNGAAGKLYYSPDRGTNWKLIAENIDLNKEHAEWRAPDTFSTVIFRMQINNENFISDTSMISSRLMTGVGFNCSDSFLINWSKASNISSYTVYQLGNKYLEPLATISDTSIILQKSANTSSYYTVAANVAGKSGLKSYTFNYNAQGVGCYIKNFLVDLNTNVASLQLELGTLYDLKDIVIEKWSGTNFIPIKSTSPGNALQYHFTDSGLRTGGNVYRIRILLKNGVSVYSRPETIFYLAQMNYLVYPNPAKSQFQVVSKDSDDAELILYNAMGQKISTKLLQSTIQTIPAQHLKKGLYFIHILQKNRKVYQGSIVIQ